MYILSTSSLQHKQYHTCIMFHLAQNTFCPLYEMWRIQSHSDSHGGWFLADRDWWKLRLISCTPVAGCVHAVCGCNRTHRSITHESCHQRGTGSTDGDDRRQQLLAVSDRREFAVKCPINAETASSFMQAFVLPVWEQQCLLYPASCHPLMMLSGQHSLFSDDRSPDPAVLLKHCQLDPGSHSLFSDHWPLAVFLKCFVCWTQAAGSLRTAAVCKVPVGMGKIKGHVYSQASTDLRSRLKCPKPEQNPTNDATHCQRTDHCLLILGISK